MWVQFAKKWFALTLTLCVCVCVIPSWRRSWSSARGRGRSSRNTPTKSCSRSPTDAPTFWSKSSMLWRTAADTHSLTPTYTHTERSVFGSLTPNTLNMFPLLSAPVLNKAFNLLNVSVWSSSQSISLQIFSCLLTRQTEEQKATGTVRYPCSPADIWICKQNLIYGGKMSLFFC